MKKAYKKIYLFLAISITFFATSYLQAQCTTCDVTVNAGGSTLTLQADKIHCISGTLTYSDISWANNATICIPAGSKLTIQNNMQNNVSTYTVNFEIYGELDFGNPQFAINVNMNIHSGGKYKSTGNTEFSGSSVNINNQSGTFEVSVLNLNSNSGTVKILNSKSATFTTTNNLNVANGVALNFDNQGTLNVGAQYGLSASSKYSNCGIINTAGFNLGGAIIYNTGTMNISDKMEGSGTINNYSLINVEKILGSGKIFKNTGKVVVTGDSVADMTIYGPTDLDNYGEFEWGGAMGGLNDVIVYGNQLFTNSSGTSSLSGMFQNTSALKPQTGSDIKWSPCSTCIVNTETSYCIDSETGQPQEEIPTIDYCDQVNPPNGSWPVNSSGGTEDYAKQLLFFDWGTSQLDASSSTATATKTINGITYTAKISDFTPGYNGIVYKATNLQSIFWGSAPAQLMGKHYSVAGIQEVFYRNDTNSEPPSGTTSKAKITITANSSHNSTSIPLTVIVFDAEATNPVNEEQLIYKTSGSPFTVLRQLGTSTLGAGNNIIGNNTTTVTYNNSQTSPDGLINVLFSTNANKQIEIDTSIKVRYASKQGFGFAVRLPCPVVATDDTKEIVELTGPVTVPIFDNDHYGDGVTVNSSNVDVVLSGGPSGSTVSSDGKTLTVPGEGTWTYDGNGNLIFTPETGFTKAPTPINYTIIDKVSFVESTAKVSITLGYCYKNPMIVSGSKIPTKHGITSLSRAAKDNEDSSGWPLARQSGWMVLESTTKGFVPNRLTADAISKLDAVEGMMVYDTTNHCLKIYDGTKWGCLSTPTCPNN